MGKDRGQFATFADGRIIRVRVTPKAAANRITREIADGFDFRVRVTVAPEGGKANRMVIRLLAEALGVPKNRVELVQGETARDKLFRVV